MEEVIIFMIFIICFLGVWVTRLSNKIKQLEYELVAAQVHFEKDYRDVLLIIQKDANAHSEAYSKLTQLVSKQVVKNMEAVGELQCKFNDLRRYVINVAYVTKEGDK